MMMLITYDVSVTTSSGRRRLRRISKTCLDYGMRVQNSVFECEITPSQWVVLKMALLDIFDPEQDSLRFYSLGANWQRRVEHYGAKSTLDVFKDTLIL